MWFAVLGPTAVVDDDGAPVLLGQGIPRTVLAVLLAEANRAVSVDRLGEAVWGGKPPPSAETSIRNHVARLRHRLGPAVGGRIRTSRMGYRIEVRDGELDEQDFADRNRRGQEAVAAGDWGTAAARLADALALWRGDAYADLASSAWNRAHVQQLAESRLQAWQARIDADLRLGRHREVLPELFALTTRHPLYEALHGQLMLALYRSGRQAEAQDAFHALRRTLADELAVEPSAKVCDLHRRIIANDPALDAQADQHQGQDPDTGTSAARVRHDEAAKPVVPVIAQLPTATGDFAGRHAEIEELQAALDNDRAVPGRTPIVAVTGGGGLGKTSLAVQVAHLVAERFPDGQLFVDLHGMDAFPRDPADVLRSWLAELGTAVDALPTDLDSLAARFRSLLAGKRVLVVIDNAKDAAHVSPLLPATSGCAVLATSRDRLAALPGCRRLDLEPLSDFEALSVLEEIAGAERLRAEPPATSQILQTCTGLPLALRIAGARLRSRPSWPVAALADRLADQRRCLDELRIGDLAARTSFEVSFRMLPPSTGTRARTDTNTDSSADTDSTPARLFTLLGLVPGSDITVEAASALAGIKPAATEAALETLVDTHLVQSSEPGRYHLHDLLRVFAAELADSTLADDERSNGVSRLVHWYSHAASAAADRLGSENYQEKSRALAMIPLCDPVPRFADSEAAQSWFGRERANLLALLSLADAVLPGPEAWVLAVQAAECFHQAMRWSEQIEVATIAERCARRVGDQRGVTVALYYRVFALGRLHRRDEALDAGQLCVTAAEQLQEPRVLGSALNAYGAALMKAERPHEAIAVVERACDIAHDLGEAQPIAVTEINLGIVLIACGRRAEGDVHLAEAIRIAHDAGDVYMAAYATSELGVSRRDRGESLEAVRLLTEAAELHGAVADHAGRAESLLELSAALLDVGRGEEAGAVWGEASRLVDDVDDALLRELRSSVEARLAGLPG